MEGESIGRSAFGAAGGVIGGIGGAFGGAAAGSVVPVAGNIIGGIGGAVVGGEIGSHVGVGLYDGLFGGEGGKSEGSLLGLDSLFGRNPKGDEYSSVEGAENVNGDVPPSKMRPEDAKLYTFNYLTQNGFSKEQAAGIIGNIMAETGGFKSFNNPNDRKRDGTSMGRSAGIVQWNGARLKEFQRVVKKDPLNASLKEQLDFMMYEFKHGERGAYNAVTRTNTAKDAALAFEDKYERSAKLPGTLEHRVNSAEKVLKEMTSRMTTKPKTTASLSVPETPTYLPKTSTPLKDVSGLADMVNTPTIMMPQVTNVNAPSTTVAGNGSGGSQVVTVRDSTTPFTRNADKHTGFNFAR